MSLKNNRGFSLVEIMIVVGLLAGISLIVMNLTKQSSKSSTKYQFDTEINLITSEINAILSNPNICKATFQANALTPTNIDGKYYTVASGSAPSVGYGNAGVKITNYSLTHSTLPGATPNDGILTILFQNKTIVGGTTTPRKINIYYEGPITAITTCRSLSTSTVDIWSHGTGNDIYYGIGNVGIGTATPAAKLDIAGGVKLSSDASACTASNEGTQRYDSVSKTMQFCNGTAWTTLGAPAPTCTLTRRVVGHPTQCNADEVPTQGYDNSNTSDAHNCLKLTCL